MKWEASKNRDGSWSVRNEDEPMFITFEAGCWAGGCSTEMLARNEAARRNGDPLPFPEEMRTAPSSSSRNE